LVSRKDDEETVKTNCYRLLHNVLGRIFGTAEKGEFNSLQSLYYSSNSNNNSNKLSKNDEIEFESVKASAKNSIFDFIKETVIRQVISVDLLMPEDA